MKTVTYCYWRIPNEYRPGTHVTRYRMPRDVALAQFPSATEAGGHEQREIPESQDERAERLRSMIPRPPRAPHLEAHSSTEAPP